MYIKYKNFTKNTVFLLLKYYSILIKITLTRYSHIKNTIKFTLFYN